MLRCLASLLVLVCVAWNGAAPTDGGAFGDTAASAAGLAAMFDNVGIATTKSGQNSSSEGLVHGGGVHCLHALTLSAIDADTDPDATCDRLRWGEFRSFLIQLHSPPSHPPPVSAA